MVTRYRECLPELTARQRRVLRMRAGVGPRDPASRATVARRLDLSVARVRRAERRGLRALRRACGDGAAQPAPDGVGALATAGTDGTVLADGALGGATDPGARGGAAGGSDGNRADAEGGRGGVKGTSATVPGVPPPAREEPPLMILLVLLAAGAGWYAFTRLRDRYYGDYY